MSSLKSTLILITYVPRASICEFKSGHYALCQYNRRLSKPMTRAGGEKYTDTDACENQQIVRWAASAS